MIGIDAARDQREQVAEQSSRDVKLLGGRCIHGLARDCDAPKDCPLQWYYRGDLYVYQHRVFRIVQLIGGLRATIAVALFTDGSAHEPRTVLLTDLRKANETEM